MSVSDALTDFSDVGDGGDRHMVRKNLLGELTLSGNLTLTTKYRNVLRIDPGGSARDILLPAEQDGVWFEIVNTADAAENLVVKDDSDTTTVVTLNQNEKAMVWSDGTSWYHTGVVTIAQS